MASLESPSRASGPESKAAEEVKESGANSGASPDAGSASEKDSEQVPEAKSDAMSGADAPRESQESGTTLERPPNAAVAATAVAAEARDGAGATAGYRDSIDAASAPAGSSPAGNAPAGDLLAGNDAAANGTAESDAAREEAPTGGGDAAAAGNRAEPSPAAASDALGEPAPSSKPVSKLTPEEVEAEMNRLRNDTRYVKFKASDLNPHIVCRLCNGYFRDAHTISECLHTFCKSCLLLKLSRGAKECPALACNTALGPSTGDIVADRQMQSLVDKLFPQLDEKDLQDEEAFYKERGIALKPEHDKSLSSSTKGPARKRRRTAPTEARKQMNVKLVPDDGCAEARRLPELAKPYLRTSVKLRMLQLQKYLQKKLEQELEGRLDPPPRVELIINGEVLGPEHSLEYVGRTRQMDAAPTLVLQYRRATE